MAYPGSWQVVVLASALGAFPAWAADTAKAHQTVQPKPVPVAADQLSGPANQITQAMFNSGVRTCAPRVNQITNFLTGNSQSGAFLFVGNKDQDHMLVSASMEIQAQGSPLAYASASFTPGTAIGCGGMYETVVYWNGACRDVAAQMFKDATPAGALMRSIAILNIGSNSRVFLMPAGQGCVSIKKEVLM